MATERGRRKSFGVSLQGCYGVRESYSGAFEAPARLH
jgi:hypothetical protein